METFTPLQLALKAAYESSRGDAVNCNQHMLRELENDCFIVGDLDISQDEIPLLCKFMSSKEALTRVTKLVVSKKMISGMSNQRKSTVIQTVKQSALQMNKGKLQYAVIDFIARSHCLSQVVFDSVIFKPELFGKLGQALSTKKGADLRLLSFCNVPLKSAGLRSLCTHIGKTAIQRLDLEKCSLDSAAGPFICSILKAQEARLDQLYWNSTLRLDPEEIATGFAEDTLDVYSDGLVVLNLAGNALGDEGIASFTKQLETNHWLLGVNLSHNAISHDGIEHLATALERNTALQACVLRGNPGLTLRAVEAVGAVTAAAEQRLDLMPEKIAATLQKWIKLQASEAISLEVPRSFSPGSSRSPSFTAKSNGANVDTETEVDAMIEDALESTSADPNSGGQSNDEPQAPLLRKKGGKTPPLSNNANSAHANWREMEDVGFGNGRERVRNFDGEELCGSDSLEFAIPTPVSGSDFQGSAELSVRASGDFYQQGVAVSGSDGRPPSRNSLRPRSLPQDQPTNSRPAKTIVKKPAVSSAVPMSRPPSRDVGQVNSRYGQASSGVRWPEQAVADSSSRDESVHRRSASAGAASSSAGKDTRMRIRREQVVTTRRRPATAAACASMPRASSVRHDRKAPQTKTESKSTTVKTTITSKKKDSPTKGKGKAKAKLEDSHLVQKLDSFARSMENRMARLEESVNESLSQSMSMPRDASASFSSQGESPASRKSITGSPTSSSRLTGGSPSHGSSPSRYSTSTSSSLTSRQKLRNYANTQSPSNGTPSSNSGSPSRSAQLSSGDLEGLIRSTLRQKLRDFIGSSKG